MRCNMQRTRWSKILQNDYVQTDEVKYGAPILQSHGKLVSRGDLITQDNIALQNVFTITVNGNNFSSLCTQGTPGQLISYGFDYPVQGTFSSSSSGIYVSDFGPTQWKCGPQFYLQLPETIGLSNMYWHIILRVYIANAYYNQGIFMYLRVGHSIKLMIVNDYNIYQFGGVSAYQYNSTSSSSLYNATGGAPTGYITLKFYHYQNNTSKFYRESSTYYSGQDKLTLDNGDNIITMQIVKNRDLPVPTHYIQQITVSTDPSYDPQP